MIVGWTRGEGCRELATLLDAEPSPISDDLRRGVIDNRIELLVTKNLSTFDLTSVAVPDSFDVERVTSVVAAVGGGAHSPLAAEVASTVAGSLGLSATLATVYRPDERADAERRLEALADRLPGVKTDAIESHSVRALLEGIDEATLLVVGAPGGSWLNRQLFGPGHKLIAASVGGTITVRVSERRVFHAAVEAGDYAVGVDMHAATAYVVVGCEVSPVAGDGRLVGIIRRRQLAEADPGASVGDLMEDPVSLRQDEPLSAARELREHMEGCPIPVTESDGRLVGVLLAGSTMDVDGELGQPG